MALEVEKDKSGGNPTTHKNLLKEVWYIASLLDLVDIWRALNPAGEGGNPMCTVL